MSAWGPDMDKADGMYVPPMTTTDKEMMERLRFTRKGWFRHAFSFLTGSVDARTGTRFPDEYGCFKREVWVGPFPNARAALQQKG